MGLGRLHNTRSGALQSLGPCSGLDLQLVELVRATGTSTHSTGSHHLTPLLLAGVARLTQHAGQSRLLLTLTHAAGDLIKSMVANVRKGLDTILATAPQLTKRELWMALVRYIVEKLPPPNQKTTFNLR